MKPHYLSFNTKLECDQSILNLSWIGFADTKGAITKDHCLEEIAEAKVQVKTLNLSANQLGHCPREFLIDILQLVPSHIGHIDLSLNFLGDMPATDLKEIYSNLPASIKHLDLHHNQFKHWTRVELIKSLQSLPNTIESVNMAGNIPAGMTIDKLQYDILALHKSFHIIDEVDPDKIMSRAQT